MSALQEKLDATVHAVVTELGNVVAGIVVMGSITREATRTSDMDVSVVLRNTDYNARVDEIRDRLRAIAAGINDRYPDHEIVLWASKEDHYRTLLPDVSYVRRNLPYAADRLDAWCGLAKLTLAAYEAASSQVIHGTVRFPPIARIPRYESIELFLLSTRTLAEGIAELASTYPRERRNGVNHVAKAGLRAAYAALSSRPGPALNSYKAIHEAALAGLPEPLHPILGRLYELKTGRAEEPPDLAEVLRLMRHCEHQIAGVARARLSGVVPGREGESFAFDADTLFPGDGAAPLESYARFAGLESNYVHSLYFLITAAEIVQRLARVDMDRSDVLEFFFEEIAVVATLSIFNPAGLWIQLGVRETTKVTPRLGAEALPDVISLLSSLASGSIAPAPNGEEASWLPRDLRFHILRALVDQLAALPHGVADHARLAVLQGTSDLDSLLPALKWQTGLLRGLYSEQLLRTLNGLSLHLYQAGRLDDARTIASEAMHIATLRDSLEARVLDANGAARLRSLLSTAHQYHGITLHRAGDLEGARRDYLSALDLDPDNISALDDLSALLLAHEPDDGMADLLIGLAARGAEARRQVAQRFVQHAIDRKQAGSPADAERWYRCALQADPSYEKAHYNYALLLHQQGEWVLAETHYARAIELDPKYLHPYMQWALLRESRGDFRGSIEVLSHAIREGLENEQVWTNLGNSFWKAGDPESARRCFVRALSFDSGFADAWNGLGILLMSGGSPAVEDLMQALEYFGKAIDADPSFEGARANYMRALLLLTQSPPAGA